MQRRGLEAAAADRRRDHVAPAHRGPDRAGVRAARPCTCWTRPGWSAWCPTCSTPTGPRALDTSNRAEQERLREQHANRQRSPLLTLAAGPGQPRAGRRSATCRCPRSPACARSTPSIADAARDDRLAVPVPGLGAEGQVPGDPRPAGGPRTVRRRQHPARRDHRRRLASRPEGVYGFWPAPRRGRRHRARRAGRRRFPMLRQQTEKPAGRPNRCLADYVAPAGDHLGGFAVAIHGAEALAARTRQRNDDYRAIMVKALADRLAEAFAEYIHLRGAAGLVRAGRRARAGGPARRAVPRASGRRSATRPARTTAEKQELFDLLDADEARPGPDRVVRDDAGRQRQRPDLRQPGGRGTSPSAGSAGTRSRTTPTRRGMPVQEVERWLRPNLAYDPA